jgi:hypothetical protein
MQKIPREIALFLIKNDLINDKKSMIMCKNFATDDEDFVEVLNEDYECIKEDEEYQKFEIWLK